MTSTKRNLRGALVASAGAIALLLSGCGVEHRTTLHNVSETMLADGGEEYFNAGPITYQVQISRQLNPFSTEDVQYLAGVKNAQNLPPGDLWFGVFLWAKNQSGTDQTTASTFKIVDSAGTVYNSVPLNPSVNPFAFTSQKLVPNGVEPDQNSIAAYGPTQGALVLFKLNESIYSNRPLTLQIFAPGSLTPSTVSLDL